MPVLRPADLEEALRLRGEVPGAVVVAGGTEVMVARSRGELEGPLLDLSRVRELRSSPLGAAVTYTELLERGERLPLLALAARTVASRQIRNRATIGGTVALADPSSDVLTALLALDASVELRSATGGRTVGLEEFLTGPYECDLRADELVVGVHVADGSGRAAYAKVGARNAMARAACAVAVSVDASRRRARIAVAACAPTPVRARPAEARFAQLAADGLRRSTRDAPRIAEVAAAVAGATQPRSDRRGSAAYKRHAAGVLARRALTRALGAA